MSWEEKVLKNAEHLSKSGEFDKIVKGAYCKNPKLKLNSAQKDVLATIHNIMFRLKEEKLKRKDRKALRETMINLSKELSNFT